MANIEALADMSGELKPKEREPMLSDRAVSHLAYSDMGIRLARAFYENLITTGKLRVVEEVDNVSTYPGDFRCSVCDGWTRSVLLNYCPGCGNKIKR